MLIKPHEGRPPWPRHPGLRDRAWLGQGEAETQVWWRRGCSMGGVGLASALRAIGGGGLFPSRGC